MYHIHILFAFIVAVIVTAILIVVFRHRPGVNVWIFLIILFLGTWAGGVWVKPFGPPLWGDYWLSFLAAGLFIGIIIAAIASMHPRTDEVERRQERETEAVLGFFFWVLIIGLIFAVIAYYMKS